MMYPAEELQVLGDPCCVTHVHVPRHGVVLHKLSDRSSRVCPQSDCLLWLNMQEHLLKLVQDGQRDLGQNLVAGRALLKT